MKCTLLSALTVLVVFAAIAPVAADIEPFNLQEQYLEALDCWRSEQSRRPVTWS